jgi:two-component system NarL family response regulator
VSGKQKVVRVIVVDDHLIAREGLRAMLSSDPGIEVVGEAGDGEEALEKTGQLMPDVVLMDVGMPKMGGVEATRKIKEAWPTTAVIVLTVHDSEKYLVEAIRAGAAGYLLKDLSRELLRSTISIVVGGGTLVRSSLLRRAMEEPLRAGAWPTDGSTHSVPMWRLTARELEVLRLMAQGRTNKEIAEELHVAEFTVKKHVQNIIRKMGVSYRTQAAIVAVKSGLVD